MAVENGQEPLVTHQWARRLSKEHQQKGYCIDLTSRCQSYIYTLASRVSPLLKPTHHLFLPLEEAEVINFRSKVIWLHTGLISIRELLFFCNNLSKLIRGNVVHWENDMILTTWSLNVFETVLKLLSQRVNTFQLCVCPLKMSPEYYEPLERLKPTYWSSEWKSQRIWVTLKTTRAREVTWKVQTSAAKPGDSGLISSEPTW